MVHVPLIIAGPGVCAGGRSRALVSSLDLVPLFYRTVGAPLPPTLQGVDLRPVLAAPAEAEPPRTEVFSENQGRVMVFDGRYKLCYYATGETELYDLGSERQEERDEVVNLAGSAGTEAVEAALMGKLLQFWLANTAVAAEDAGTGPVGTAAFPARVALEAAFVAEGRPQVPHTGSVVNFAAPRL